MSFERARQPEQIAQRRESILSATLELFEEQGFDRTRLADIGRRAGVSKATVYRYFESKEAIFLELLEQATEEWVRSLESELASLNGEGTVDGVARAVAGSLDVRPRLCSLASRVSSVLEKNLSQDAIRDFKRGNMALTVRLVNAVHAALPALSLSGAQQFVGLLVTFQNGLYPVAYPAPATEAVLAEPEFAPYRQSYRDVLFVAARLFLVALTVDDESGAGAP